MSLESLKTLIANDAELGDDLKIVLPRVKERLKNQIPYSFYPNIAKAFDNVYGALFPPPEEDEWTRIQRLAQDILANDLEHQEMLRRFERDRVLREKAFSHFDGLMHLKWSLYPDNIRPFFKEPKNGTLDESVWDTWVKNNHTDHLQPALDELEYQRGLLDTTFQRYRDEVWGPKPITVVVQGKRREIVNGVISSRR